jgi:hypothetical protein
MQSKLIRVPAPLAKAIAKGAHRKETTQNQFIVDAIATALIALNDDQITKLLGQYTAEQEAQKGTPNHE